MRVLRVPVVTAAVLGLVLLAGCRNDDYETGPWASSGATAGAEHSTGDSMTPTPSDDGEGSAAARRVVDAATAGGLSKATGEDAAGDAVIDPGEMRDGMNLVMNNYLLPAGEGGDGSVLMVAVDNVPEPTTERREYLWRGMLEHIGWDYDLGQPGAEPVADPGPLGGSVECTLASLAEDGDVICGWADAATAGVAHFPNSTLPEASALFVAMRADLEK